MEEWEPWSPVLPLHREGEESPALETPPCGNQRPGVNRNEKYYKCSCVSDDKGLWPRGRALGVIPPGICPDYVSHSDGSWGWFAQGRGYLPRTLGARQRQL